MITGLAAQRKLLLVAVGCMAMAAPAICQGAAGAVTEPAYDVVSIKPNKSGSGSMRVSTTADRFAGTNVSLKMLIQFAWNLKTDDLISGLSGWANSSNFDVEAKVDAETLAAIKKLPQEESLAARRVMMQRLLEDRFKLIVHHETKELQSYALVVAKGGFKLKEADPNATYANGIKGPDGVSRPGMMMVGNGKLNAQAIPIANLAINLSGQLHRQVLDQTGLKGKYDIALRWTPDDMPAESQDATGANAAPSIFTALQEQLGLKLEATKGPTDTIVVDHVEMPSEN